MGVLFSSRASGAECVPVSPDLLAWFRGGPELREQLGGGMLSNVNGVGVVSGHVQEAYSFTAADQALVWTPSQALTIQDFTVDAWIRRSDAAKAGLGFEGGVVLGGGMGGLAVAITHGGRPYVSHVGHVNRYGEVRVTDTAWHHLAVVRAGSLIRFYVDGMAAGEETLDASFSPMGVIGVGGLGEAVLGSRYSFLGQLDEVALHRVALSMAQVRALYDAGVVGRCRPDLGLELVGSSSAVVSADVAIAAVLRNKRQIPVKGVRVELLFPNGLEYVKALGSSAPLTLEDGVWRSAPFDLAGAQSLGLLYELRSIAGGVGDIKLRVTSAAGDESPGDNEVTLKLIAASSTPPVTTGLVAYYPLAIDARDVVSGDTGTLLDGASFGVEGTTRFLRLPGGGSRAALANPTNLFLQEFTISAWARRSSAVVASPDFEGGVLLGGDTLAYHLGVTHEGRPYSGRVGVVNSYGTASIQDTSWHHVAVTRTGSQMRFFVDGILRGEAVLGGVYTFPAAFAIGALPNPINGARYGFAGSVTRLAVYNRPCTPGEIGALAAAGLDGGSAVPDVGLNWRGTAGSPSVGEAVLARLEIVNSGNVAVRNTSVRLAPGSSIQWTAVTLPQGARFSASDPMVLEVDLLPAGATVVLEVAVTGRAAGEATLSARVSPSASNVWPGNDESQLRMQILPGCAPFGPGVAAWLKGEGNALDSAGSRSGNAEPGVVYGEGKVGQAFQLNGSGGVWMNDAAVLNEGTFTIETWVRPTAVDGAVDAIAYRETSGQSLDTIQFGLGVWGTWVSTPNIPAGNLVFFVGGFDGMPNESFGLVNGGGAVPLNQWTHVALSVAPGRVRAYVNGVKTREISGLTGALRKLDAPLGIGTRTQTFENSGLFRFNGGIDEFGLHSRELTEAEVKAIHDAGALGRCDSDLAASFQGVPQRVVVGETVRARLRILNQGRQPLSGVVLTNPTPAGWTLLSATSSVGVLTIEGGMVRGSFGTLASGGGVDVDLVYSVAGEGAVELVATLASDTTESALGNNVARATVEAGAAAVSVFPASGREVGPGRTSVLRVPVRLFAALSRAVSVKYATGLAPATPERAAASAADFQAASGTLEFAPGETEKFVEVVLTGDAVHEFDEVFAVTLSEPTGMALGVSQAVQTIEDDEAVPGVQIGTVRVREGADAVARVPVTLSGPSSVDVDLAWTATPASAVSPADYVGTNGTVRIPAGATTALVEIQVAADAVPEGNEHFAVTLTIPTGPLARVVAGARIVGDVVILDDDVDPSVVRGFEWSVPDSTNPDGTVAAQLAAVTVGGTIASNYSGTVRLTTSPGVPGPRAVRPPRLAITEVLVDVTGEVELQNVSSEVIDLSGWRVHFYDWRRWPLPRTTLVIPAGTTVPRAGVFSIRTTGPSGTGSFPTFRTGVALDWRIENAGVDVADRPVAVLLQDPTGAVEDFFSTQGADPGEIDIPVTVRREDWAGFPVAVSGFAVASHQRRGWMRSGTAADWILGVPSLRARNPWLRVPFADGVVTAVTPAVVATFENGRWAGALQLATGARGVRILAEDGGGRIGVSPLVLTPGEETLRIVEFSSSRPFASSSPATSFRVVVSNGTPASVVGTDLTVHLDGGFGLNVRSRLTRLSISQGTAALSSAPQNGLWPIRSALGSVAPGGVVVLEFSLNLEGLSALSAAATGLSLYALAEVTAPGAVNGFPAHDRRWLELPVAKEPAPVPDRLVGWWRDPASSADVLGQNTMEARINIGTAARHHQPVFRFEGDGELRISHRAGQLPAAGDGLGFAAYVQLEVGRKDRMVVMEKAADTTGKSLAFVILDGRPAVEWDGVAYPVEAAIADLRDGRWHHLVWVLPPGGAPFAVRVDQAPIVVLGAGSGAKPSDIGNGLLRIGGGGGGGGIVGLMQDPILYHEAGDLPTSVPAAEAGPLGRALAELSAVRVRVASPERSLVAGRPQTQWLEVANEGVTTADAVRLVWRSHSGVTVTSASRDGVAVPATKRGDLHLFDVGAIPAGGSVRFRWTFVVPAVGPTLGTVLEIESGLHHRVRGFSRTFVLETDVDADGIGDAWERENGLNPADGLDGFADLDGDGFANRAEYEAGTLPRSAGSVPQVAWSLDGAEAMVLRTATTVDRDYVLERNDRLSGPASWSGVERRPGTGSVIEFRVVFPAHADAQFYRIRPVPLW